MFFNTEIANHIKDRFYIEKNYLWKNPEIDIVSTFLEIFSDSKSEFNRTKYFFKNKSTSSKYLVTNTKLYNIKSKSSYIGEIALVKQEIYQVSPFKTDTNLIFSLKKVEDVERYYFDSFKTVYIDVIYTKIYSPSGAFVIVISFQTCICKDQLSINILLDTLKQLDSFMNLK